MGEAAEEFTAEEKVILGEDEPEIPAEDQEKPPVEDGEKPSEGEAPPIETKEPEHVEAAEAAEKLGLRTDDKGFVIDDEGTRIPVKRWRELYYKAKEADRRASAAETGKTETERKFKLFQVLGPDKYYGIYPDETPADFKPAGKAPQEAKATDDPFDMVAQYTDPNHPMHGKTLREVYQEDPAEGRRLEREWEQGQQEARIAEQRQRETTEESQRRVLRESEEEVNTFYESIAKHHFGKEARALSKEESAQVTGAIQDTLDFMQKTRRGAGILADAYFLMNKEKIVTEARTKGGKAALESLQKPGIQSIGAGSGAASTGMDAYEAMNADQLAEVIETMTEKQYAQFMKNASPALKAKHPGIPWD